DSSNNIYVADYGNHAIRKISNGVVTTLAGPTVSETPGFVDAPGSAARFNGPMDLAVDSSGAVYVADYNNNAIRKVSTAGVVTTPLEILRIA
ncbi:hypothetical protein EHQ77_01005, partial [Leptospira yasudae]